MEDPVGAAPGIPTLVAFACQSSNYLYETVSSFQTSQRTVRELREELEALNEILESLQQTAATTDIDLTSLELPIRRCGKACTDFTAAIDKCTEHSSGARTSFRDWEKLTYMGDDVSGFKNVLAIYKSIIIIVLADSNLHTSVITGNFLIEFQHITANTISDLDDHLRTIDTKLHAFSLEGLKISDADATSQKSIQEEKQSAKQCLNICTTAAAHIKQVQSSNTFENISTPEDAHQMPLNTLKDLSSARLLNTGPLKKERVASSTARLTMRLKDLNEQLGILRVRPQISEADATKQERIREEIDTIKQCLAIYAEATKHEQQERSNVFEDISMADDGHQMIVSAVGDLILARRVTAGSRSMQLMGQMSDDSILQLSQNRGYTALEKDKYSVVGREFEERYGGGLKLS